jgi:hypothetical protein
VTVREAFAEQAVTCEGMGSPFTARLCRLVAARLEPGGSVADRILGWPGDPRGRADALPLRLAGALHGLVLDGSDPGLAAVYPPNDPIDDALWSAVIAGFEAHATAILARLDGPPQTNEPMRSAALGPGFLTVAARTGLPLVTSELGASAGLNLIWDRFAYRFGAAEWGDPASPVVIAPDWHGPPPPLPPRGCSPAPAATARRRTCAGRRRAGACCPSSGPTRPRGSPAPPPPSTSPVPPASPSSRRRPGMAGSASRRTAPRRRPCRLSQHLLAVPAARGAGPLPRRARRRRRPRHDRGAARLAAARGRRRNARRGTHPHPLARRRDAPPRPRRLSRRLDPLDGMGGKSRMTLRRNWCMVGPVRPARTAVRPSRRSPRCASPRRSSPF